MAERGLILVVSDDLEAVDELRQILNGDRYDLLTADRNRGIIETVPRPCATMDDDRAARRVRGQLPQLVAYVGRIDLDARAGRRQKLRLPRRRRAAAGKHCPFPVE